jgi:hypothetical protein
LSPRPRIASRATSGAAEPSSRWYDQIPIPPVPPLALHARTPTAKQLDAAHAYTDPALAGYKLAKLITGLPDELVALIGGDQITDEAILGCAVPCSEPTESSTGATACTEQATSRSTAASYAPNRQRRRRQAVERRSNDSGAVAANRRLLGRSANSSTSGRPLVERQLRGLLDLSGWEALVARIGAEIVAPPHEKESRGRRGSRGCIPRRAAASRPRPPWRRQRQCSSDGTRALLVLVHTGSVDEADRLDPGSCSAE